MDTLNTLNNEGLNNDQILSELDKKIHIKHLKEKNKNKTFVYGIFDFILENDVDALIKLIKKRLGCSGMMEEESVRENPKKY